MSETRPNDLPTRQDSGVSQKLTLAVPPRQSDGHGCSSNRERVTVNGYVYSYNRPTTLIVSTASNVTSPTSFTNDWQRRCSLAVRILAGFEFLLILATLRLWWGNNAFPAIPLIRCLALPIIADRVVVCILLAACVFLVGSSGQGRWNSIVRSVGLAAALMLCITNQQRLQAWHWLFVLGLGSSFFQPEHGLQLMRTVLASVYVCSALSRMAPTAHQGMSAAIVDQLLWMIGIKTEMTVERMGEFLCHAVNVGELAVGLLLIWPKSRRYGILSVMLLHGTLLLALGPLGLGHHLAVLIWNVCFLCLIPVVFSGPVGIPYSVHTNQRWHYCIAMILVWLYPLSGLVGTADNWTAWQLYSTRPESWTLRIHETDVHYLDESLRVHVSKPAPLDDWVTVKLDRWSLAETDSPLYPEDRFQCEVIRRVLSNLPADAEFRVEISEPERWFWWKRIHRTLKTRAELTSERSRRFW